MPCQPSRSYPGDGVRHVRQLEDKTNAHIDKHTHKWNGTCSLNALADNLAGHIWEMGYTKDVN